MRSIAVLVGSLRAASINRKFAEGLERLGADLLRFDYPDLDLPLYNDDLWADPPESVLALKERLAAAEGVLFVTPEYNRSFTPVIKNAFDWASRPSGQGSWAGKPVAIAGASPGAIGTAVAQSQLRAVVASQGVVLMGRPEVYFQAKPEAFDAEGAFASESTRKILRGFLEHFAAWVERHAA